MSGMEPVAGVIERTGVLKDMPKVNYGTTHGEAKIYESRRSDSIAELALALLMAQRALKPAAKDAENPFFNSRYADLGACMDAVKEAYNAENICIIQRPLDTDGSTICIETILLHTTGEYISGILRLKPTKADPQGLGSCLTYARRYALGAITGLVTEEDDDGNAASAAPPTPIPVRPANLYKGNAGTVPAPVPLRDVTPPEEEDLSWMDSAHVGYLVSLTKSKKLTTKGQPFGDATFILSDSTQVTVTWFKFSGGWTYETLARSVMGTEREVFFTMTAPSNPKYKPILEHFYVQDLPDAAQ
jgi:hypothetical protein